MRKYFIFIFILAGILYCPSVFAEQINDFQTIIQINKDSSLNIEEKIDYDFEDLERHGIFRDIPIKYKARGGNFNLRIFDIHVTDENNIPYKFKITYPNENVHIRIGDANTYVTGKKTYIINYTIKRAINYFDDYDELYWNITGNDWDVNINQVKAIISLPKTVSDEDLQEKCFTGFLGDTNPCASSQFEYTKGRMVSDIVFNQNDLNYGQGLSIVVGLPKDILIKPSLLENFYYNAIDNWVVFIPLLVILICYLIWYKRGRDPKGRGTIIAQFEPPKNLSPAEVGTIYDEKADKKDVSAEIINLAIKGYLKINRTEKGKIIKKTDYEFTKLKEKDDNVSDIEWNIMTGIFNGGVGDVVKMSSLYNSFYTDFDAIVSKAYAQVIDKEYFVNNPRTAGNPFYIIGGAIVFLTVTLTSLFIIYFGIYLMVSLIASGLIIAVFGIFMPQKTKKGVMAKEHILGLKEYLTIAEKDRIKFHNAPEKNPQEFEKLLPYAIVLGVEQQWAKQFQNIYQGQEPSWYSDNTRGDFNAFALANGLSDFQSSATSTLSSRPAPPSSSSSGSAGGFSGFSSGGGFSGGGSGGGGGGSW